MRSPRQPSVWIISGPSGVGKGTVCAKLRELRPGIHIPVSLTTRQPRPGEIDGISYHFVPEHRFREMAASGQLLEHAVVHGRYSYGTPARMSPMRSPRGGMCSWRSTFKVRAR